jgi:phage tail tape-measure protein
MGGEAGNRLLLPGRGTEESESMGGSAGGSMGGSMAGGPNGAAAEAVGVAVFSSMWPQFGQYRPAGDSTISCWQTGHFMSLL